jgi:hypothetical protein
VDRAVAWTGVEQLRGWRQVIAPGDVAGRARNDLGLSGLSVLA